MVKVFNANELCWTAVVSVASENINFPLLYEARIILFFIVDIQPFVYECLRELCWAEKVPFVFLNEFPRLFVWIWENARRELGILCRKKNNHGGRYTLKCDRWLILMLVWLSMGNGTKLSPACAMWDTLRGTAMNGTWLSSRVSEYREKYCYNRYNCS